MYVMDTEHNIKLNSTCRFDKEAGYMDHTVKETSVLLTQYCLGDQIETNKMGRACSMYGGEDRHIQGFGGETQGKETTHKTGINGRIILRWIFRKWDLGVWTGLSWLRIGTGDRHL